MFNRRKRREAATSSYLEGITPEVAPSKAPKSNVPVKINWDQRLKETQETYALALANWEAMVDALEELLEKPKGPYRILRLEPADSRWTGRELTPALPMRWVVQAWTVARFGLDTYGRWSDIGFSPRTAEYQVESLERRMEYYANAIKDGYAVKVQWYNVSHEHLTYKGALADLKQITNPKLIEKHFNDKGEEI